MEKCSNIKKATLRKENINVIYLDLRNSTTLNIESNPQLMVQRYDDFLSESYGILKQTGYKNIDIQGDGIYGVIESEKYEAIVTCIKQLQSLIVELENKEEMQITMCSFSGKEYFSCFGLESNQEKQMAFFNGLVSLSKKIISSSSKKYNLIINDKLKTELEQNRIAIFKNDKFKRKLTGGQDGKEYWVRKR